MTCQLGVGLSSSTCNMCKHAKENALANVLDVSCEHFMNDKLDWQLFHHDVRFSVFLLSTHEYEQKMSLTKGCLGIVGHV